MRGAFKGPATEFASEPHRPARNATAGVQDWSVGPTYPLSVTVVGNPHVPETVRYVAMDLHDATAEFPGRLTYADAYCDAVSYLAALKRYGSRERLRLVRNLHATKGAVNWAAVAHGPPIEYDEPEFATVKPEDA